VKLGGTPLRSDPSRRTGGNAEGEKERVVNTGDRGKRVPSSFGREKRPVGPWVKDNEVRFGVTRKGEGKTKWGGYQGSSYDG